MPDDMPLRLGVYYFTPPNKKHGRWIWVETGPGFTWERDDEAEQYFQRRGYATMRVTKAGGGRKRTEMATAHKMSMQEFMALYEDTNVELIDGEVRERDDSVTKYDHNNWMLTIALWFKQHAREWGIGVVISQNLITDAGSKLVPDVLIFDPLNPKEQTFTHSPIAVFEVTSETDEPADIERKLAKYERMGVPEIWQVYPEGRTFRRWQQSTLVAAHRFSYKHIKFDWAEIINLLADWPEPE